MSDRTAPLFTTGDALRFGWTETQAHLRTVLALSATGAFLALLQQALANSHAGLLSLAVQIIQAAVTLAFMRVALKLVDGFPVDLSRPAELIVGFLNYLLTAVLVALIIAAGFVLLIVPGVIWILKYGFATFLAADRGLHPVEALRESARLTHGMKSQLLPFGLALIGVNLLGAIALGIGLLFTIPVTLIAAAFVLRRLERREAMQIRPTRSVALTPQPSGA
jgi:uncharacterized membrane protein